MVVQSTTARCDAWLNWAGRPIYDQFAALTGSNYIADIPIGREFGDNFDGASSYSSTARRLPTHETWFSSCDMRTIALRLAQISFIPWKFPRRGALNQYLCVRSARRGDGCVMWATICRILVAERTEEMQVLDPRSYSWVNDDHGRRQG